MDEKERMLLEIRDAIDRSGFDLVWVKDASLHELRALLEVHRACGRVDRSGSSVQLFGASKNRFQRRNESLWRR